MALTDKDGNELSSLRGAEGAASIPGGRRAAPGQPGGPPLEPVRWLSEQERSDRANVMIEGGVGAAPRPVPEPSYAYDRVEIIPKWEIMIDRVPDRDIEDLQNYLNGRGAEGWEPWQIIPARWGGNVHYVHLKRRTL